MAWEQFEKIVKDIEKDLKIDRMNMDEKSLQIPSIKHYWIAELYRSKIKIQALERKKNTRISKIEKEIEKTESEIDEIQNLLQMPETSADYEKLLELTEKFDLLKNELDALYLEWEELQA